ncbi:MAG: prefoldin subunit alpha [Thermoproteota archaeon]|mgnify:FL=1
MSEEQAQQLLYQMQILESYFADLMQKENYMINVLREATSAIESIKAVKEDADYETLVPLGLGTFVKAKILPHEKIVLNVGAGAAMEKDKESTINYIESRIKEIEIALKETAAQKQEIALRLEQGKHEMNRLMQAERTQKQQ